MRCFCRERLVLFLFDRFLFFVVLEVCFLRLFSLRPTMSFASSGVGVMSCDICVIWAVSVGLVVGTSSVIAF